MKVPPEILKSVVFIGHDVPVGRGKATVPRYEGTAFFVEVRGDTMPELGFTYLVTAKHVAEKVEGNFWVRQNVKGAGAEPVPGPDIPFTPHPTDPTSDVAVWPWELSSSVDQVALPLPMFLDKLETEKLGGMGLGDEVFMAGVFPLAVGNERNTPIVRKGNLAMMPQNRIRIKGQRFMEAFLIEAHSVGGMSGAPVFVRHTQDMATTFPRETGELGRIVISGAGEHFLLGFMHGHWEIEEREVNEVQIREPRKGEEKVNYGISIVVPASKIMETLKHPKLLKDRKEVEDEYRRDQGVPIPDNVTKYEPTPGPEPERLAIDLPMDEAVKKMFEAGKPPKGR